jgi:type VII secretion-associated serine protease mycosin
MRVIFRVLVVFVLAALAPNYAPAYAATKQWHLDFLRIAQAQTISQGDGVVVGLVDSGVDATHPDLLGSVLPGTDLLAPRLSTDGRVDGSGHGTAMAGLIVGHGGILGIAPKARIMPVRVVNNNDMSTPELVASGIDFAVDHGATVINVSIGGDFGSPAEDAAVARALDHGIVVVAAAGNTTEGFSGIGFPAAEPGVVAVVGVDERGMHASSSVTGPQAVIAAPGANIVSTDIRTKGHSGYERGNGTSGAAAIVSGVVALIRSKYPKLSAAEVVHRLTATADDKGAPGRDPIYGYGIVDPVKALTADVPPLTPSATPAPSSNPTAAGPGITRPVIVVALAAFVILLLVVIGVVVRRRTIST